MKRTLAGTIFALFVVIVPAFADIAQSERGPALQRLLDLDEKLPAALEKAEKIPVLDERDATLIHSREHRQPQKRRRPLKARQEKVKE